MAALDVMPAAWRAAMAQAALVAGERQLLELIAELPLEHAALARSLSELASNFGNTA